MPKGFKKGQSGNIHGRPKGQPNKVTAELKDLIKNFLEDNFSQVMKDFSALEPAERVKAWTNLLQYALPRMGSVAVQSEFDRLSDEDLDRLISELKKSSYES